MVARLLGGIVDMVRCSWVKVVWCGGRSAGRLGGK